jgi:hypothetical protein
MITQKQFNDKYDGEYRFTAIYKDKHGDISSLNYEIIIDRIEKFYSINKNKSMYFWFS